MAYLQLVVPLRPVKAGSGRAQGKRRRKRSRFTDYPAGELFQTARRCRGGACGRQLRPASTGRTTTAAGFIPSATFAIFPRTRTDGHPALALPRHDLAERPGRRPPSLCGHRSGRRLERAAPAGDDHGVFYHFLAGDEGRDCPVHNWRSTSRCIFAPVSSWLAFSECITRGATAFTDNNCLPPQACRFPGSSSSPRTAASATIGLAIRLFTAAGVLSLAMGHHPTIRWLGAVADAHSFPSRQWGSGWVCCWGR